MEKEKKRTVIQTIRQNPEIRKSYTAVLPDQEREIVRYILENGKCTTSGIARLLGITDRRARGVLGSLVQKEVLQKNGNARNIVYLAGRYFPKEE